MMNGAGGKDYEAVPVRADDDDDDDDHVGASNDENTFVAKEYTRPSTTAELASLNGHDDHHDRPRVVKVSLGGTMPRMSRRKAFQVGIVVMAVYLLATSSFVSQDLRLRGSGGGGGGGGGGRSAVAADHRDAVVATVVVTGDDPRNGDPAAAAAAAVQIPKLLHVLAFPASGAAALLSRVEAATGTATAVVRDDDGPHAPLKLTERGPWLRSTGAPLPKEWMLTATRCAGTCGSDCPPERYVVDFETFERGCRGVGGGENENGDGGDDVGRVVHLFRAPLDNVVARFRAERVDPRHEGRYPDSAEGLRKWCRDADARFPPRAAFAGDDEVFFGLAEAAPCHAELVKYAQWHNHAFALTSRRSDVDLLVLSHEDGADAADAATRFARLAASPAAVSYLPPDEPDPTEYLSDPGTRTRSVALLKYLSSPETWGVVFNKYVENDPTIDQSALHQVRTHHAVADPHPREKKEKKEEEEEEDPPVPAEPTEPVPLASLVGPVTGGGDDEQPKTPPHPDEPLPEEPPRLAWLMSFPNSGTTYTEKLVQTVTDTAVATNYGHEYVNADGEEERLTDSLPVYGGPAAEHGPFRLGHRPLPPVVSGNKYLLTKTHCGGYCFSDCPPNWYVYDADEYLEECLRGARYDGGTRTWVQYDRALVRRAVHLVRDPLDNVVSRFNHEHKTATNAKDEDFLRDFPRSPRGFKAWCAAADRRFTPRDTHHSERTNFDDRFVGLAEKVPCFAEFVKYAQWHNNAFRVVQTLGIESRSIHYEDYAAPTFRRALRALLDFVGLPAKPGIAPPPFRATPYVDFYDDGQRSDVFAFLRYLATPETWDELRRYDPRDDAARDNDGGDATTAVAVVDETDDPAPASLEIAWLMSFPNSGTTYTEKLVSSVTGFTVATNYGHEHVNAEGREERVTESVPVFDTPSPDVKSNGPFRLHDLDLPPNGYLLTKTHCGGYCFSDCPPNWYLIETAEKFTEECVKGARYEPDGEDGDGVIQTWVSYAPDLVKRAVHLVRDPYDNVIARFHHECKTRDRENDEAWLAKYPRNTVEGFRRWCTDADAAIRPTDTLYSEKSRFDRSFLDHVEGVPCYAEFLKYAQWHDRAFEATTALPTRVLHYEDYREETFDSTVNGLLRFVHQERRGPAPEFRWHPYEGYYTDEERRRIARFLRWLTTDETWTMLSTRYDHLNVAAAAAAAGADDAKGSGGDGGGGGGKDSQ